MASHTNKNYRKVWIDHFGLIPKDKEGRSYEIHHIDGNPNNNDIINLKCVTIQEHYDIHYTQEDWGACIRIGQRMKISAAEKSHLLKLAKTNRRWITDGINDRQINILSTEIPTGWSFGRSKGKLFGPRSEEFCKRMSDIRRGVPLSEKHKKSLVGLVRGMSNKHHSEETKAKMRKPKSKSHAENISKSKKCIPTGRKWMTDGYNNKICDSEMVNELLLLGWTFGRIFNEEIKNKMSISAKNRGKN